jgi:dolichyl-phosphate-mannose-protein mannosyltransferase
MTEIPQTSPKTALVIARVQMPSWLIAALLPAVAVLGIVTLRLWLAAHMDFETDEAYYWMWSRSLAASYYDHPPMVAYLIRIGTSLFGDSILGIRSMAPLAMIGASALLRAQHRPSVILRCEPTGPARPAFARSASYGGYESPEARSAKAGVAGPMISCFENCFAAT